MLRVKLLAVCCALLGAAGVLGIVVGHATTPVVASAAPIPTAAPLSAAPSPRPGRTTVTSPTSVPDAFDTIQRALDYLRANYSPTPAPVPSPVPTPSPVPSPQPPPVVSRFPGDPGAGKMIVGAATSGGNLARVAGQKLADFYTRALSDGAVLISYYDSNVNSTQDGWEMDDTHGQLSEFHALMKDARTVEPNR